MNQPAFPPTSIWRDPIIIIDARSMVIYFEWTDTESFTNPKLFSAWDTSKPA